jgi:hypothetical protein
VIRLAVRGFHLAHQVSQIFSRLPALRGRIAVQLIGANMAPPTVQARLPAGFLQAADAYFEEAVAGNANGRDSVRTALPQRCDILTFASPRMMALWPFHGADPRLVPEQPLYHGGRYHHTDRIAARLAGLELTDDALFDAYMTISEAEAPDFDAALAADVARWEAEDQQNDVKVADFLRDWFRMSRVFTTPYERGTDTVCAILLQLFEAPVLRAGFEPQVLHRSLDRLTQGWQASRQELPVHPLVAQHFQLSWWSPDLQYRMLGNDFSFREYIIRYIRWSPWMP